MVILDEKLILKYREMIGLTNIDNISNLTYFKGSVSVLSNLNVSNNTYINNDATLLSNLNVLNDTIINNNATLLSQLYISGNSLLLGQNKFPLSSCSLNAYFLLSNCVLQLEQQLILT